MSGTQTTAGAIALVKSLFDLPQSSAVDSFSGVVKETYNWLIREKLSQSSFELTRELAYDRAFPNDRGNELYEDIKRADERISKDRKMPINLTLAGSLGRTLAADPRLRYIVTTRAALARCHPDEYVARLVCAMITDKGGHEVEIQTLRSWQLVVLKAVISKMIESVSAHITNPGLGLEDLPPELRHLHKHVLDYDTFSGIICGVQRRTADIFIRSGFFLYDLALWLIYHFDGTVHFIVDGRDLFSQTSGTSSRELFFYCRNCTKPWEECRTDNMSDEQETVRCGIISSGGVQTGFLSSKLYDIETPVDITRIPFYAQDRILNTYSPSRTVALSNSEWTKVFRLAQGMTQWLLGQRVKPFTATELQLSLDRSKGRSILLGDVLHAHPGLLNAESGSRDDSKVDFEPPPSPAEVDSTSMMDVDSDSIQDEVQRDKDPEAILSCFPKAKDLARIAKKRCECCVRTLGTTSDASVTFENRRQGCVYHASITTLFTLLGHAIAEALGARDASGQVHLSSIVNAVTAVFTDLIYHDEVNWEQWFAVAACVATGVDSRDFLPNPTPNSTDDTNATLVAVQQGSMVIWLDNDNVHELRNCFGIKTSQGTIAGVPGDFGVVTCEASDRFDVSGNDQPQKHSLDIDDDLYIDEVALDKRTVVFNEYEGFYRLLTFVRAGKRATVVDPAAALRASMRSETLTCEHSGPRVLNSGAKSHDIPIGLRVSDISDILENWSQEEQCSYARLTTILDDELKANVALSLSPDRLVWLCDVNNICQSCLAKRLDHSADPQIPQGPTVVAINQSPRARKRVGGASQRRIL